MGTNVNTMISMTDNSIFTNFTFTDEGVVHLERIWNPDTSRTLSHPNSRFFVLNGRKIL
ncbi:MAG: hypothetical protein JW917_11575 [Ignavibacteria bacterium]|nr:hypothetical protein [Ignavibacteria bacterium]